MHIPQRLSFLSFFFLFLFFAGTRLVSRPWPLSGPLSFSLSRKKEIKIQGASSRMNKRADMEQQ
jgi:hypothetical protein